jgi:hypothetical protein
LLDEKLGVIRGDIGVLERMEDAFERQIEVQKEIDRSWGELMEIVRRGHS